MDKRMKCLICKHGETQLGDITVTLEKNGSIIVFKHVPAHVCDNCGEKYVDDTVTAELLKKGQSIDEDSEVFVVRSMDIARNRVESARKSDDYMSEKEYQIEMNTFWKTV
jgi:YgiT-type zinc finger domain-containing protein